MEASFGGCGLKAIRRAGRRAGGQAVTLDRAAAARHRAAPYLAEDRLEHERADLIGRVGPGVRTEPRRVSSFFFTGGMARTLWLRAQGIGDSIGKVKGGDALAGHPTGPRRSSMSACAETAAERKKKISAQ